MINLGILAALGAALCWGTYMVPFKLSKSTNITAFQALMAVGIGLSGLFISLVLNFSINFNLFGLLSGLLWVLGNVFGLRAIANLGLSKAVPIMSSLVVVLTFLYGALLFGELPSGILFGLVGIGLIIPGVVAVSLTGKTESQNVKKGLIVAAVAGLIWGSQLVPLKISGASPGDFFFPVCLGILVSGLLVFTLFKGNFQNGVPFYSLLSGLVWNIGNLLSLLSVSLIGLSKAGPISQIAVLVSVLWGLAYFKEVAGFKLKLQILGGAVVLLLGILILGLA